MADLLVCGECDGIEGVHRAWCRYFQPAGVDPRDAEIARLKAEVAEARRHAVGVMAAGFNRALDEAGAPPAESPGLRIYAMRDEIARLKAALSRTDLGAGMVVVPRESIDEWRDVLTELAPTCRCDDAWTSRGRHEVNAKCHLVDDAKAAIADLEALLKQGGG